MLDSFQHELSPMLEGVAIIDQGPSPSTGKTSSGPADREHAMFMRDSKSIGLGKEQMLNTLKRIWVNVDTGFMHSKSEIAEWLMFAGDCNPVAGANLHWDALTSDYTPVVKSMKTKVLLMVGDATIAPDSIYTRMGAAIPPQGAHFALFPGGTHCPHHQPEHLPKLICLVEQLLNGSLEINAAPGSLGIGRSPELADPVLGNRHLPNPRNEPTLQKQPAVWQGDLKCSTRTKSSIKAQMLHQTPPGPCTGVRNIVSVSLQPIAYCRPPSSEQRSLRAHGFPQVSLA